MNKRSSRGERPRSARLRRKPSIDTVQEDNLRQQQGSRDNSENSLEYFKNGLSTKPGNRSKRLATKNNFSFAEQLNLPSKVNFLASQSSFAKVPENHREPPKSPRILPKLSNAAGPRRGSSEQDDLKESHISEKAGVDILSIVPPPAFPTFLDENLGNSGGTVQFGKHYSVLPKIAISKESMDDSFY